MGEIMAKRQDGRQANGGRVVSKKVPRKKCIRTRARLKYEVLKCTIGFIMTKMMLKIQSHRDLRSNHIESPRVGRRGRELQVLLIRRKVIWQVGDPLQGRINAEAGGRRPFYCRRGNLTLRKLIRKLRKARKCDTCHAHMRNVAGCLTTTLFLPLYISGKVEKNFTRDKPE